MKGKRGAEKVTKATVKGTKATIRATGRAAQVAVKSVQAAVRVTVAAVMATIAMVKGTVVLIAAGGWVAVLIILLICAVILVAGTIEDFLPGFLNKQKTESTSGYLWKDLIYISKEKHIF